MPTPVARPARVKHSIRSRRRRFFMQLSTMFGYPQGFFSPYRYASGVEPCAYPELEPVFEAALVREAPDGGPGMEAWLDRAEALMSDLNAATGAPPKPRWEQVWFSGLDAVSAYVFARESGGRRIVEVGSGHSTRFMAAGVADKVAAGGGDTEITCIDPEPRAELKGLPVTWRQSILLPEHFELFRALGPGDIAFFDSSHLLWPGSDVDLILNRILPILQPGVLVHVHDIPLPDAYPVEWEWRGYTEQLGLAGWLMGGTYHLIWASHWLASRDRIGERPGVRSIPVPLDGGSIWLRRA